MVRSSARKSTWPRRAGALVLAVLFLCIIAPAQTAKTASADTGKRVAQVYMGDSHASVTRPSKEWKGFAKVDLDPGESKRLGATLDQRAFSFYDVGKHNWRAEPGECSILAGRSSADIKLQGKYLLTNGQETN